MTTHTDRQYEEELASLRELFSAHAIDEHETEMTIRSLAEETGVLVDPHTAVAVAAARAESTAASTSRKSDRVIGTVGLESRRYSTPASCGISIINYGDSCLI